jgi:hypothetical protein
MVDSRADWSRSTLGYRGHWTPVPCVLVGDWNAVRLPGLAGIERTDWLSRLPAWSNSACSAISAARSSEPIPKVSRSRPSALSSAPAPIQAATAIPFRRAACCTRASSCSVNATATRQDRRSGEERGVSDDHARGPAARGACVRGVLRPSAERRRCALDCYQVQANAFVAAVPAASAARRLGWHSAGCSGTKGQRCSPLAPPPGPQALGWPSPQQVLRVRWLPSSSDSQRGPGTIGLRTIRCSASRASCLCSPPCRHRHSGPRRPGHTATFTTIRTNSPFGLIACTGRSSTG